MNDKIYILLKISIFNLLIVSIIGILMRYKIAFYLPLFEQKHLQESHSHFAFYAWVTHVIYNLIYFINKDYIFARKNHYFYTILVNLISSYGMLFSFIYGGYFALSILFSSISLLTSFYYLYLIITDYKKINSLSKIWFLGGLFFAAFSSIGVMGLSYIKITHTISQNLYLASTFFYLHFQYNGFFIFSCFGFLISILEKSEIFINNTHNKLIFWLMFFSCFFGYGLSILWLELPFWIYGIISLSSLVQIVVALGLFIFVKKKWKILKFDLTRLEKFVLFYVAIAYFTKILLQFFSIIPAVSQFAFGFRNIVIAYLHLVLLMCISTFLIFVIIRLKIFRLTNKFYFGIKLFLIATFLNEIVLGINGILSIGYASIPQSNLILFSISILLAVSILSMYIGVKKKVFSFKRKIL